MSLKLYAPLGSWRAAKALVAAQYNGIHIEQPAFQMGRDNKTPEFLRMNPLGKIPVLETEQGVIFESNAIARYVARLRRDTGLYGQSFMESAQVDQWVDFAANEAEPVACTLAYPIFGYIPFNEQAFAAAKEDCQKLFKLLDDYLLRRTFMVGNQITLADIVLATTLLNVFRLVADAQFRAPYTNLVRWYETCINQPEFVAVLGKPHLCTKSQAGASMAVAAAPAEDKKGKKEQKPKEEKKPKEQKPKEEKKPKEEAKKPAPKPKPADDDDEGSDEERKPKKPNALDLLPPTTMSMDAWKKVYSNTPDLRGDAMVQFWNMLDKSGYCLFHCSYQKAEGEGRVLYMTLNLVSGFLQRLDKLRKYAFGTMGVWGEEPELEIEGVWLFRGQEIPEDMKEHPSYEYHTWRQLSADNADDRKTVEDYWCADVEDKVNGKRCRENKCYK